MSEGSAKEREANAVRLRENYGKVYSWRTECARFREMIETVMKTANGELNTFTFVFTQVCWYDMLSVLLNPKYI